MPEKNPRKTMPDGKQVPDEDKIRKSVEDKYKHLDRGGDKIYKNRTQTFEPPPDGTVEANWDCSKYKKTK
jgi:hypothetical protein